MARLHCLPVGVESIMGPTRDRVVVVESGRPVADRQLQLWYCPNQASDVHVRMIALRRTETGRLQVTLRLASVECVRREEANVEPVNETALNSRFLHKALDLGRNVVNVAVAAGTERDLRQVDHNHLTHLLECRGLTMLSGRRTDAIIFPS